MYLPLAYINRYSLLTELYCDEEHLNCNPEMLIEMTSDDNWEQIFIRDLTEREIHEFI